MKLYAVARFRHNGAPEMRAWQAMDDRDDGRNRDGED